MIIGAVGAGAVVVVLVAMIVLAMCLRRKRSPPKYESSHAKPDEIQIDNVSSVIDGQGTATAGSSSINELAPRQPGGQQTSTKSTGAEAGPGVDVFISFRFTEAHTEALVLKKALEAAGCTAFVSDVCPGANLQQAISRALSSSTIAVVLASKSYGTQTNSLFDTCKLDPPTHITFACSRLACCGAVA